MKKYYHFLNQWRRRGDCTLVARETGYSVQYVRYCAEGRRHNAYILEALLRLAKAHRCSYERLRRGAGCNRVTIKKNIDI